MNSKEIIDLIKDSNSIAIFTHIKPDGDCLGSGMALYYFCKNLGKIVDVYNADNIHSNYNFLVENKINKEIKAKYDLFIAVDTPSLSRLGDFENEFVKHENTLNIDHHISNEKYAKYNYVKESSSCCEVLYDIFDSNKINLDTNIAQSLYCGLSSDTGGFRHSNTTSKVLFIAAKLSEYDIDLDTINYFLYKSKTKNQLLLYKKALEKLCFYFDDRLAITGLDRKDFLDCNADYNDDPRIVDDIAGVNGVQIGITYSEKDDGGYNISFRSNGLADVNLLAQKFGGGGHTKAAGCRIYAKKDTMIKLLIQKAKDFIYD